jgi:hypothetical protein
MTETPLPKKRVALSLTGEEQRRLRIRASVDGKTMSAWVMDQVSAAENNTAAHPAREENGARK